MTAKVFEENPGWSVLALSKWLEDRLMAEIVFLPWDTTEKFGHADGICRYAGNGSLIMTNYRQFDAREIVKMGGAFNCCSWTVKR